MRGQCPRLHKYSLPTAGRLHLTHLEGAKSSPHFPKNAMAIPPLKPVGYRSALMLMQEEGMPTSPEAIVSLGRVSPASRMGAIPRLSSRKELCLLPTGKLYFPPRTFR